MEGLRAYAQRLLRVRPRSEKEFIQRLRLKGFPEPEIQALVSEFQRQGILNDAGFSRYFAQAQMTARPVARRQIVGRLRAKGISEREAAAAVEAAAEGVSDLDRARALAGRRTGSLDRLPKEAAQRRLFGFLSRRGFSPEVVERVVRERFE